ncbi:MAG: DUF502 domain-containing protein [Syntrophomonadaceae bacterium]|jgi:uncharacterized membrane protein
MKRLANYFIKGLLFMVPIVITIYVVYIIFVKVDSLLRIPLPGIGILPGLGFVITLAIITLTGFLVSNFVTQSLLLVFDQFMSNVPLVKILYGALKDLLNALAGDKKSFNRPVLVKLGSDNSAHVLGFITCDSLARFGLSEYISVYIPQSYNFAGQLLVFPRDQVHLLDAASSDIMAFIISGGVTGQDSHSKSNIKY